MTLKRILVVDDELEISEMLSDYLQQQNFEVAIAKNGEQMRQMIAEQSFDLLLLDKSMPGEDGFSLARFVREHYTMGIIMLTGTTSLIDKIIGLEIGADDYITKPFDLRELLARIKSVLRRKSANLENTEKPREKNTQITLGSCLLNISTCKLTDQNGIEIPLTSMEFKLLEMFLASPNRVLSREYLLEISNQFGNDPFDRSIDTHIYRIRKKVEEDPGKPKIFKTVRSAGYMYVTNA